MKQLLNTILDKIHHIESRLTSIDQTLGKQEAHLEEHIRRTGLLEDQVLPIQSKMQQMTGAFKLLTGISVIAGIIGTIKLFF